MSRFFAWGFVVFVAVSLAAAPVLAQTTVTTGKANVTLSGKLDITEAYRSGEYFTITKGDGLDGGGFGPFVEPGLSNAERVTGVPFVGFRRPHASELYMDPNLSLRFGIEVEKKVRGLIELRTPFVNPDAGGKNTSPGTGFFANTQNRTLEVKQLYAEVSEILRPSETTPDEGLLLRAGIQDFRKSLRNGPDAFVIIDTAGSEHPFDAYGTAGAPMRYSTGFADSTEAAGGYARYRVSFLDVDAWMFDIDNAYNAMSIGEYNRRNLYLYGASTDIYFDADRKKWGKAFLTVFDMMPQSSSHVVTEGGGATFKPIHTVDLDPIEIFGEVYFQQGTYAKNLTVVTEADRVKQEGAYALNLGILGKIPGLSTAEQKLVPYGELSYVQVSGDDRANDSRNSNFVSLENTNSTLIVENGYYGLDIDTNYRGPRIRLGATIGKVQLEALYAYFELMENGGNRISGAPSTSNVRSSSNKIGDEIDVSIGYEYSANLHLKLTSGWLLDEKALGESSAMMITLLQVVLDF